MSDSVWTKKNLVVFANALWQIFVGAFRIFAWDSLNSGFIDLRRLGRVPRLIALTGLALVFIFIASILFNDPLRTSGILEPLPLSSAAARGIFVPSVVVPLSLIAVILAWSLLLTSALHLPRWARWGMLLCFVFFGLPADVISSAASVTMDDPLLLFFIVGAVFVGLLGLLVCFIVLPRWRWSLAREFTLVLVCIGGLFIVFLIASVKASQLGSVNFVTGYVVAEAVTNPRNLTVPLIYLSGTEIISFGITFTSWGAQSTARYARAKMVYVLLGVFLAYRWFGVVTQTFLPGVSYSQWLAWAGAALAGACLIPLAWWRARDAAMQEIPFKLVVSLVLLMIVPHLLLFVLIIVVSAFFLTQVNDPNAIQNMTAATNPLLVLSTLTRDALYPLLTGAGIVVAVYGWRRKKFSLAAFGAILAWTQFVWWFMENGQPLQALRYRYADMEMWLLLSLTALTLYWGARKTLTPERALKLFALAVFTWLLHFVDFLDNPLSLFFGLAGISYTAFGILWGVLTAGGRWKVNGDSPRFPNKSRVLIAIGYVLLTLNVTHWFMVTHNIQERTLNDDFTFAGLRILGYTAAYLVVVEGGRALLQKE